MVDLIVLACVVFAFAIVLQRLEGTVLTAPLVFVLCGAVLGQSGLGLVEMGLDDHAVLLLGEIALALVLFADAASTDLSVLRRNRTLPLRLLGIGMPLTIALGTMMAALLFADLTVWEAAIVGTVLAPTDAALGQAVVSNPRVPARIRQALNVEAGLNDGLSVPFLALFLILAESDEAHLSASAWARFALEQVGLGVLVGVGIGLAGGWLVAWASRRGWMTGSFRRLALLALALVAWALADQIGGNGFIAAFVGGLAVGPVVKSVGEQIILFTEAEGQLLSLSVFFVFGALAIRVISPSGWEVALYALLSLTAIRVLPVALSLIRTRLAWVSVLFTGWFGPRGLASIVLGLIVVAEAPHLAGQDEIEMVVASTVLLSVFLHGLTAAPLSAAYARRVEGMAADAPEKLGTAEASTHPRCQDETGRQRDGSDYLPDPRGWRVVHRRRLGARNMDEEKAARGNSRAESEGQPQERPQAEPPVVPAKPNAYPATRDAGWAGAPTSQVARTVAVALLTAVVVLVALFLLWQVRTFVGWFVIALFLAAVLNPVVNWLQQRHRLIKRPLAIALTYVGLVVVLLFVVVIFLPLLVDQINGFIRFVNTAAQAPEGPTQYIKGLLKQNGLGGLLQRIDVQLSDLRKQLGEALGNVFSATGQIAVSAASFLAALATVLTLTFFLILGSDRYVQAGVGLFSERHQPLVRRILGQAAGAVSGYVTGNLAISVICGVTTFVVLLVLGMPYAAPLALLVAVLDLVPLVGATLGGALLVIVGLFVEPWKAVVLLVFVLVYQQVESNMLQPLVYSQAVQLNGLVILIALLVGGQLLGIPGALLAIPVAEIIRILITEIRDYWRTAQEASETAVASSPPPATSE